MSNRPPLPGAGPGPMRLLLRCGARVTARRGARPGRPNPAGPRRPQCSGHSRFPESKPQSFAHQPLRRLPFLTLLYHPCERSLGARGSDGRPLPFPAGLWVPSKQPVLPVLQDWVSPTAEHRRCSSNQARGSKPPVVRDNPLGSHPLPRRVCGGDSAASPQTGPLPGASSPLGRA